MKRLSILLLLAAMTSTPAAAQNSKVGVNTGPITPDTQTLRNPVISGFHPDPSVCRVGDTFYLINSSFQYFPGVPLYESRDLVNWQLKGNVLNRASQLNLEGATSWTGIYAPTIRYDKGTFYMITTNIGHGQNFLVTAKNPEGPWSEPLWLEQGGIDPSLYFENGRCYMVSNPNDGITLCEINPQTGQQLTQSKVIWRGTGGRYPEGPHIYKKDGYYYLLISEGGTELAHRLTIARSRNIYGPYEANPANPILTNCSQKGQLKQIQGTGHGDIVQAKDGSWWIVFLAYRNMGGSYHHLGRETFLAPVEWPKGGWPVVNGGEPIDTLTETRLLPQEPYAKKADVLRENNPAWVYLQNPDSTKYEWIPISNGTGSDKAGSNPDGGGNTDKKLRLYGSESSLTANRQPTFIGRRQEAERMTCEVTMTPEGNSNFESGLTVYQINDGHYDFFTRANGDSLDLFLRYELKGLPQNLQRVASLRGGSVHLCITSENNSYVFSYSQGDGSLKEAGRLPSTLLSTEVVGGFTGVTIGMFANGKGQAIFANWKYSNKKH